jgi:hypothetical protein
VKLSFTAPARGFGLLDALGVLGLVGLLVARFLPVARLPFWRCALRQLTGWPCPGCGLTRAADHLAHGRALAALEANPMGAVAGVLFALLALYALVHFVTPLPQPVLELTRRESFGVRVALLLLLVLNYAFVVVRTRFPHLLV